MSNLWPLVTMGVHKYADGIIVKWLNNSEMAESEGLHGALNRGCLSLKCFNCVDDQIDQLRQNLEGYWRVS